MAKHSIDKIEWREIVWQRPFNEDNVYEMLTHLATLEGRGPIVWESRSQKGYVKHIIGADTKYINKITDTIKIHGDIAVYPLPAHIRIPMKIVRKVNITKPSLTLNTNVMTSTVRAGLDFMTLPRYEIYANVMSDGKSTGWVHGKTLPPPASLKNPAELRALSQTTYGRPIEEVEKEFLEILERGDNNSAPKTPQATIGRRKL